MEQKFLTATLKASDGEVFTFVASDESIDRQGETLPLDKWELKNFKKQPRMMLDHDHRVEKIVGKWINVRIEKGKLLMDAVFHEITELSREVKEMVTQGFLNTVSVGYIPPKEKNGKNELVEVSLVTVPANPQAVLVKSLMEKAIPKEEKEEIEEFIEDAATPQPTPNPAPAPSPSPEPMPSTPTPTAEDKVFLIDDAEAMKLGLGVAREEGATHVQLPVNIFESLVGSSEKQMTLPQEPQGKPNQGRSLPKERVLHAALKEASKVINHALYQSKQK